MGASEILDELASLRERRAELDAVERELIEEAREAGVGWAKIAVALGLGSRQAAEQRLLRLVAGTSRDPGRARATRNEQRIVDEGFGLARLRAAAVVAQRRIAAQRGWDAVHPRAGLVRVALELAVSAPPGALYELVRQAVVDGGEVPEEAMPGRVGEAMRNLALTFAECASKI